jgi:hypothetical protein
MFAPAKSPLAKMSDGKNKMDLFYLCRKVASFNKRVNKGAVHQAFYGILNGNSELRLSDGQDNNCIQLMVTESGEPKLTFLDDRGNVVLRLPEGSESNN